MGDLIQLVFERTVERWMAMAVEVDPDGGDAIEIPLSSVSIRWVSFPRSIMSGSSLFPFLHLGEWMPEIRSIPVAQLFR